MCVDMNAKVTIFNVENLDHPLHEFEFFFKIRIILKYISNTFQNIEDNSTWSLDIFADEKELIVGCGSNNKKISVNTFFIQLLQAFFLDVGYYKSKLSVSKDCY